MKHRTSTVVPPLLALALGACAADAPTAPAEPPASAAARSPSLAVQGEPLAALRTAVSDAASRILPALGEGEAHAPLRAALARADQALASDDAAALAGALREARAALAAEREAMGEDAEAAPDLDVLLLLLDGLDTAVPASVAGPAIAVAEAP
ncbi:MAG: hypothetical protein ACJ8GN_15870 [Longimicrobiaceae bacterium]